MDSPEAAPQAMAAPGVAGVLSGSSTMAAVSWAVVASTLLRIRRGEGALLAVNLSLVAWQGMGTADAFASVLISILTIGAMYAFNDLYDAPTDSNNPKKDRALITTYLEYGRTSALAILGLKVVTLVFTAATLGAWPTVAVAAAMFVNVVYSTVLKGVPVVDVVWCGIWGALYATIVTTSPLLVGVVGLMTAVCHLYQALDDRVADAENAIVTTAVRSPSLSRNVLVALSAVLVLVLRAPFGTAWAVTAFTPLAIHLTSVSPRTGWLLTKAYFGVMWLGLLGITDAAG